MGYLRHVNFCNSFNPAGFLPLRLKDARIGFVRHDHAKVLADYPRVFTISDRAIRFSDALIGRTALTQAMCAVSASLLSRGLIAVLRHEPFAITAQWGGEVLLEIDRGVVPFFGTRSYGVHLNGIVDGMPELMLWIGRRARDKMIAPGKLDNIVAGGISSGYDAVETLVKEAEEEASIPAALARQAKPVGALSYRMAQPEGMRDDVLFVFDLAVPKDFIPCANDGEVEQFNLISLENCLRLVAETDDFKFNVNLVLIDLGIRHGMIGPDHPDYLSLVQSLSGWRSKNE